MSNATTENANIEGLVNTTEIARRLGVSRRTIYKWTGYGDDPLPHMRMGGVMYFRLSQIENWLERRRVG